MLAAGLLNREITIEQRSSARDAAGQESTQWDAIDAPTWAWFKAPSGASAAAERIAGDREISTSTYSVRIRYRTDVTAGMRIVETIDGDDVVYDIKQVIVDIAGREFVDLVVTAGSSVG